MVTKATHLFEKYRPAHIADIILLPRDRVSFESFLTNRIAPHILLIGPPGVGIRRWPWRWPTV